LLKEIFTKSLKPNVVENVITPIHHFHDFLNTNYAFLSDSVHKMKETYGTAIKWATFVNIELFMPILKSSQGYVD